MTLGDRIRTARERAGYTQGDVASALHTSRGTVSDWERDKARPRSTHRLRAFLGVDEDYQPLPDSSPAQLARLTSQELVSQIRLMAAELGRRADYPTITERPGAEAELRQRAGSRRIVLPAEEPHVNRHDGDVKDA